MDEMSRQLGHNIGTRFVRNDSTSALLYMCYVVDKWVKLSISLDKIETITDEFGRCDIELSGTVHEVEEHISCTPDEDWEGMILNGINNYDK